MPNWAGIHYMVSQQKATTSPPLLLIHGAGGMSLSWPPHIRRLPDTTVLAPDLPDHGKSARRHYHSLEEVAAILLEWLDGLQLAQVDCCGHSMGGAIGLLLSLLAPQRVRKLILIGSAARLPVNPQLLQLSSHPETLPQAVELLIRWSFAPSAPQKLKELTARRLLENPATTLYRDLSACNRFDLTAELQQIQAPTLLLTGEQDRMTPVAEAQRLAEHLPRARLEILPNAGHLVVLEQPQRVAQRLWAFCHQEEN
ncbi:MAG: alpha/beta hydrolase [Anaerolineales bacterium]|nr:alpha/beta hydrolase [Anaerolineales bacterium]